MWRWGESNPRPSLGRCGFSGRSLCRRSARPRPLSQTPKSTGPAWKESRVTSRRRHAARSLDDASTRDGITHGLTDYRARLRSEGEVRLLLIGSYWFAGGVHEITLHPRPASRSYADDVETDHPRAFLRAKDRCHTVELPSSDPMESEHIRIQRMRGIRHSRTSHRFELAAHDRVTRMRGITVERLLGDVHEHVLVDVDVVRNREGAFRSL